MGPALTALLLQTQSSPGVSWRVGVGKVEEAEAESEARAAAGGGQEGGGVRAFMRQASRQGSSKVKAAIMTISLAVARGEEGSGGAALLLADEATGDAEGEGVEGGAAAVVQLWRADLVAGIVELGPGCTVLRAEPAVGRLFGVPAASLLQHQLYK
jgi:hypothetical protein